MAEMLDILMENGDRGARLADLQKLFPPLDKGMGSPILQVKLDREAGKIIFNKDTEALSKLEKLAGMIVNGMNKADSRILEYSKIMGDIFDSYISLGLMFRDNGRLNDVIAPHMTVIEPLDPNNIYGGKWGKGVTVPMMGNVYPKENLKVMPTGGVNNMGIPWEGLNVYSSAGSQEVDWASEAALREDPEAWEKGFRSFGYTRFPVVSIHVLDDLIISMAIVSMKKKFGDKMPPIQSVWDAGRMPVQMREEFAIQYNKAEMEVMKHNRFFDQISKGLQDSLQKITSDKKLRESIEAKQGKKALRDLTEKIHSLRTKGIDYEKQFKNVREAIDHSAIGSEEGMLWAIDPGTPKSGRKNRQFQKTINSTIEDVFGAQVDWNKLLKDALK